MHRSKFWSFGWLSLCALGLGCSEDSVIPGEISCIDGAVQCKDGAIHECKHGIWLMQKTCQNGCDANAKDCVMVEDEPSKTCESGASKCVNGLEMACSDGAWEQVRPCSDGCNAQGTKCLDEAGGEPTVCQDGEERLENGVPQICSNGEWVDGCDDCQYPPECTHEGALCENGTLVVCEAGLVISSNRCDLGCLVDKSGCMSETEPDPEPELECQDNEMKCQENALYTCQSRAWREKTKCDKGCLASGKECAECINGEISCLDGKHYVCHDGLWQTTVCPYGCSADGKACESVNPMQPTRYLEGSGLHSPMTPYVAEQMRSIAAKNSSRKANVFMKVGDSHYDRKFDGKFMQCFSDDTESKVTLDGRTELEPVIRAFQEGTDSFNRASYAAVGGSSTRNLFQSTPDNITKEVNDISPRFAFFGHGCNDMGNGCYAHSSANCKGYAWALQDYYRQVNKAMDTMIQAGVIPLISAIAPRNDAPENVSYLEGAAPIPSTSDYPKHMSSAFNAVARGNAEARQLPFYDTYLAFVDLPNRGISGDNLHASHSGSPCNFTSDGLQYGANTRNLGSLEMLNRAWQIVVNGKDAPDSILEPFKGSGTASDPFMITSLPYTHSGDTSKSSQKTIHVYSGCTTDAEAGAEYFYKLEVKTSKRVRMFAVSATGVDVDIHLMRDKLDGNACIKRNDIWIQGTLKPGTYYISVDTYSGSTQKPGLYLFGIVECDADDAYCDPAL